MSQLPVATSGGPYQPRLKVIYRERLIGDLVKKLALTNVWQAPRLTKMVVNMGVGQGKDDMKYFDQLKEDLSFICAQLPAIRRAKKSIAGFKLRQGQPIGLMITLRRDRMWEFLDRLVSIALPRIRDFRGLDPKGFDHDGNYNFGLRDHHIFPEINLEKSLKSHGMNITFVIETKEPKTSQTLLEFLGLPFRKPVRSSATGGH